MLQHLLAPASAQAKPRSIVALPPAKPNQHAWWVEVQTSVPLCTYYFGPFDHRQEARMSRAGYVEDLREEGARDIIAVVKQCQPMVLTIDHGYYSAIDQDYVSTTAYRI